MFRDAFIYALFRRGQIPDVYLQNPVYFDEFRAELKQRYGEGITSLPYVGIHVRRGDYVNNPFYVDLSQTDYYERAMAIFPGSQFKVFSDDPDFCTNRFKGANIEISRGTELEDFNNLASCQGIICANSSFSWWAAYLSNAKVIFPKQYHPDGVERTVPLKEWTLI